MFDALIKNANILTMDNGMNTKRWLAISGGKIVALGNNNDEMPEALSVYDLEDKTVLPGFIDTHIHGTLTGEALKSANLNGATSYDEVMRALEDVKNLSEEFITASGFNSELYQGKKFDAESLDEISKDKPIIIYDKSYHGAFFNTKAMEMAKIMPEMPGVVSEEGKMTGEVNDDISYFYSLNNIMRNVGEETIKLYMKAVSDFAVSKGVTTVHSLDGGDYGVDMPAWILYGDTIDLQVINYWETTDFEKVLPYEKKRIGGCICLDGSRAVHTMALMRPYADRPETRGLLYYNDVEILNFVRKATEMGMQCSMHATGPRAIDQYIYLLKQALEEYEATGMRHRIEHFSYPTDEQINMAAEMELALPMQPVFTKIWDEGSNSMYKKRFGVEEAANLEPIGDIIRSGGKVSGGSDCPVTMIDPLEGIDACVNTENLRRKISMRDALKVFTYNGAWAAHEEKEKGSLELGKNADMVVLDSNPLEMEKEIAKLKVCKTFIKGKLVYDAFGQNSS